MLAPGIARPIVLAAAALSLLLPEIWAVTGLTVSVLVWLALRPPLRAVLVVTPLVIGALALLLLAASPGLGDSRSSASEVAEDLGVLLDDLDQRARHAAREIDEVEQSRDGRLRAFEALERLADSGSPVGKAEARSWFLFDPNGEAFAWAGRGLVHEIDGEAVPRSGRTHVASFSANTFISVVPLDDSRRPWRAAVGISLSSDELPGSDGQAGQWAIVGADASTGVAQSGDVRVSVRGSSPPEEGPPPGRYRAWASLLLGLALLFQALQRRLRRNESGLVVFLVLTAVVVLTVTWSLTPWMLVPFAAGILLTMRAPTAAPAVARGPQPLIDALLAVALVLLLLVASAFLQSTSMSIDLGSSLGGGAEKIGFRLSMFALIVGILRALRRPADSVGGRSGSARALLAAAVLLGAGAIHGWWVAGVAALLVGAALAISWARRGGWSDGAAGVVSGCVLAALIAAIGWEVAYHRTIDDGLQRLVEKELAPPTETEVTEASRAAARFFESVALEELTVGDPEALEPQDLAFSLWRRSPLQSAGRLSRVTVGAVDVPLSSFSYRLLPTGGSASQEIPGSRLGQILPGWEGSAVEGWGMLTLGGGPWSEVRYEFLLRPGFRTGGSLLPTLAEGLLRRQSQLFPQGGWTPSEKILIGLYAPDGAVVLPPWKGAPNLGAGPVPERIEVPNGWARTFVARDGAGIRVAFLPVPAPLVAVERVATHSAGPLLVLLALGAVWFVLTLGEPSRMEVLRSNWRSFSRRLVVLYSVLLLVPILLVNILVLRVFADRLEREQRAAGQAALESAQRILGDYVFSLDPGFGIDTAVGDDVLLWLSTVVHHDVNLYWGSRLSGSSKRELFASGLLPQRIPGDIFARIALEGASLASRTTRAGGAFYEEFYSSLEAPGVESEDAGLFVSTPLLAQEAATAEELRLIRRRIFLAGAGVALLLVLIGRRVGRSFTRPLLQIVEGTQAIAAGAPSISVDTTDTEFVTLVDAIDEMARRIAAARADLLREKEVVDRMVDNITSGMISVDREGRVLLLNRTAHELLGVRVGDSVTDQIARTERLAPVSDFLAAVGSGVRQRTATLADEGGEEKEWTLVWVPLAGAGEPAALFVIEDVTEVLRGQRLEAWAEMARMIAHEVKNPLTPIRLSTEHLREVHRARRGDLDEVLERCTSNILEQVDELHQIASDFSAYSRIPEIDPRQGDLADLVEGIVEGYRTGASRVSFERLDGPWRADFDAKLLARAVRNVLENAMRATQEKGDIAVSIRGQGRTLEIRIADTGAGIAGHHLPKIFEPYFSTEDSGTGLGLPIAKRIVEEHGGSISARRRSPHGLEVVMSIPRSTVG